MYKIVILWGPLIYNFIHNQTQTLKNMWGNNVSAEEL